MVQHNDRFQTAAPPDEAGHRGRYSRPDEVLEMHAADQPPAGPPLHGDSVRLESASDGVNPVWMLAAALALVAITAFFILVRVV
jgi:hypothetical protein